MSGRRAFPLGVGFRRWHGEVERLLMEGLGIPMTEIDDLPLEAAFFEGTSPKEFYEGVAQTRRVRRQKPARSAASPRSS